VSSIFDRAAPHPVLACVQAIDEALTEAVDLQVGFLSPADRREALLRLTQLESRVAALRMRVMAVSDDVARSEGARDVAALVTTTPGATSRPTGETWPWPTPSTGGGTRSAPLSARAR
jgi:hypothetical protein